MTVFEAMQEEEIKFQPSLFLITDFWLQILALYTPLDSSWKGGTVLEGWAYCVSISVGYQSHLFISSELCLCIIIFFFLYSASVGKEVQEFGQ